MTEFIGYIASAIVLISFLMKNIKKLRIINTIGCLIFIVYGILLNISVPIIITNSVIVGINIYFLIKMKADLL
ncbi:MAG: uroporphyrinogen decarboxylase [Bacteroidetes bacterium]|nr:uroporphyrinogen decarboxylase [Bacteroidota bacterium]